jgi:hypothetical protein
MRLLNELPASLRAWPTPRLPAARVRMASVA